MGTFDIDEPGIDLEELEAEVREAIERKRGTRFSDEDLRRLRNTPLRPRLRREDLPVGLLEEIRAHRERLPEIRGGAPEPRAFEPEPVTMEGAFATGHGGLRGAVLRLLRRLGRRVVCAVMNLEWMLHRLASEVGRLNEHLTTRIDEQSEWVGRVERSLSDMTGALERRRERDLQLIHNLVFEVTDLRLRAQEAQDRIDELTRGLRQLEERERTLEELVLERRAGD